MPKQKLNKKIRRILAAVLCFALFAGCIAFAAPYGNASWTMPEESEGLAVAADGVITWVSFDVPCAALEKAMQYDIAAHKAGETLSWIDLLAFLGAKYGGSFDRYKAKDMETLVDRLKGGEKIEEITKNMKYFSYYKQAYTAVLGEYLGEYSVQKPDENGGVKWVTEYGLKVFSPIAGGYYFDHYDDFCNERTYGYTRKHFGHDLMCSLGTPITAVESGIVEELGWNQYGGWRVGIRSFDKQRYYYYAHMRRNRPYHPNMQIGSVVKAGDVIGYVGRTGYSTVENTNNITSNHLHWGVQLIFDESKKDAPVQIWIDLYEITKFLNRNRSAVIRVDETKEYYRKYDFLEENLFADYHGWPPTGDASS